MADRRCPTLDIDLSSRIGDFDLTVKHRFEFGGVHVLFGPSGSGKTSLLRLVSGLEQSSGSIAFAGEVWQGSGQKPVPAHARRVGYVFQDARLFDHLNVMGNLRYAQKRAKSTIGSFEAIVASLDLQPFLTRSTDMLSGGEKQRVALGRALLLGPKLLLLDEPLAGLDGRRKAEILPYIQRLAEDFSIPMLYVTHAVEEIAQIASDVTLIDRGQIVASGAVAEMLERADVQKLTGRFEAGVVVDAKVAGHDPDTRLTELDLSGHPLVMPALRGLDIGQIVKLRIRARDVAIATSKVSGISIRNQLPCQIIELRMEDETPFVEVVADVSGVKIQARITRAAVSDLNLKPGSPAVLLIKSIAFDRRGLVGRPQGRAD